MKTQEETVMKYNKGRLGESERRGRGEAIFQQFDNVYDKG